MIDIPTKQNDHSALNNNQKSPLVSVIMPVYNNEKYLSEAIESILKQTFTDFQFIIVDDGSRDRSPDIINSYAKTDNRIQVITLETNRGISYARNLGLSASKSKYIAVMNADDISYPQRLEKQVAYLETHPAISVLGSQIVWINSEGIELSKSSYPLSPGHIRWGLIFGCQLIHPVVIMRRTIFAGGGFQYNHSRKAMDYDLWVKLSRIYKLANLPDCLLYFRKHDDNYSTKKKTLIVQDTIEIINEHIHNLIGINISNALITGIMDSSKLKNIHDATSLSEIIIRLQKNADTWEISRDERLIIRRSAAMKLRSIWRARNHSVMLLPFLIYSIYLSPKFSLRLHR